MFCRKCGNQLEDTALFCPNCGEKCSTDISSNEQPLIVKTKISFAEKFLRFINIIAIIFTILIGSINLVVSNITGGMVILLTALLLITLVFRKKQISKIKSKLTNNILRKLVMTIIYLLLPIVLFTSVGIGAMLGDSNSSTVNPDIRAISYAESVLEDSLKNPESLQIHNSRVYVDFEYGNYHYYSITIDYSAQNGFGGYNRNNDYDVLVKVNKSDNTVSKASTEEYLDAITQYNNSK